MITVCIQYEHQHPSVPSRAEFTHWTTLVLNQELTQPKPVSVTIRLADEQESAELNQRYRHRNGPTNVLSFPSEAPPECGILGDILLCVPKILEEVAAQGKTATDHFAHLTIHGLLHLLGYDHHIDHNALIMEQREITYLHLLGIRDPYA